MRAAIGILVLFLVMGCAGTRATIATEGPVTVILDEPSTIRQACVVLRDKGEVGIPDGCVNLSMVGPAGAKVPMEAVIFCPVRPLELLARCLAHEAAHIIGWRHPVEKSR